MESFDLRPHLEPNKWLAPKNLRNNPYVDCRVTSHRLVFFTTLLDEHCGILDTHKNNYRGPDIIYYTTIKIECKSLTFLGFRLSQDFSVAELY
jgi:hypothetical protein